MEVSTIAFKDLPEKLQKEIWAEAEKTWKEFKEEEGIDIDQVDELYFQKHPEKFVSFE